MKVCCTPTSYINERNCEPLYKVVVYKNVVTGIEGNNPGVSENISRKSKEDWRYGYRVNRELSLIQVGQRGLFTAV